jgi:hypothetical protein
MAPPRADLKLMKIERVINIDLQSKQASAAPLTDNGFEDIF